MVVHVWQQRLPLANSGTVVQLSQAELIYSAASTSSSSFSLFKPVYRASVLEKEVYKQNLHVCLTERETSLVRINKSVDLGGQVRVGALIAPGCSINPSTSPRSPQTSRPGPRRYPEDKESGKGETFDVLLYQDSKGIRVRCGGSGKLSLFVHWIKATFQRDKMFLKGKMKQKSRLFTGFQDLMC